MRHAFISDVHANLIALEAVLNEIDSLDIDKISCAGDVVGYYSFPNETVDLFRSRRIASIAGNHDRSALSNDTTWMNSLAAEAVTWTHDHLSPNSKDFLTSLNKNLILEAPERIGIYHGSPVDQDEYVYEEAALPYLLEVCNCHLLVLGHTHVPFVRRFEAGTILNPGSVGQPRDGDPRASFATIDTDSEEITIHRVGYNIEEVVRKTIEAGLPESLGERLRFGL